MGEHVYEHFRVNQSEVADRFVLPDFRSLLDSMSQRGRFQIVCSHVGGSAEGVISLRGHEVVTSVSADSNRIDDHSLVREGLEGSAHIVRALFGSQSAFKLSGFTIDSIECGDQTDRIHGIVFETAQQIFDSLLIVLVGEAVKHMLTLSEGNPEVAAATLLFVAHQHARGIDGNVRAIEQLLPHGTYDARDKLMATFDPLAHRRLGERQAAAFKDLLAAAIFPTALTVQRFFCFQNFGSREER